MICDICKEEIKEPFYVEVNAIVIKYLLDYVGSFGFTPEEKGDLTDKLNCHINCWRGILQVKKGKKLEVR